MISEDRKDKMRLFIEKRTQRSDERRQYLTQRACRISIWYICIYSVIEVIWKSILSRTISAGVIDFIRLITMLFVYIFFLSDNKVFRLNSDDNGKTTILNHIKILFSRKNDERLFQILGISYAFVFIYNFLFLIIEIFYKIIYNKWDMIWFDYVLFISMIVIFSLLMRKDEAYGLPTDSHGEILDKESKKCFNQRKMLYLKQSIQYTTGIFIIGIIVPILSHGSVYIFPLADNFQYNDIADYYYFVKMFVLEFLIVLVFSFVYGEYKVKKYHKKLKSMEE
jgi:hypothetical protein